MAKTATSVVAVAVDAAQPLKNLFGVSTAYATGGNSTTVRFGDYSSVSGDPTTSDCAFATQQYFDANGSWRTRIVPLGDCGGGSSSRSGGPGIGTSLLFCPKARDRAARGANPCDLPIEQPSRFI